MGGPFMEQSSSLRLFGRVFLVAILVLVAVWILRPLLPALAWAGVLALATWPAREWLIRKGMTTSGAAISLTLLVGILIVGPLIVVAIEMAREAVVIVRTVQELREIGLGTPSWVMQAGSPGGSGCGQGAFGTSRIARLRSLDAKPRQRSSQPFSDPGIYVADAFLRVPG